MYGTYFFLAFLHPLIDNPKIVSNYAKCLRENKTDRIDLTAGLKSDDFEILAEINNLKKRIWTKCGQNSKSTSCLIRREQKWGKQWEQPNG